MNTENCERKDICLKKVLRANAVFSGLSGLLMTFGATPLAEVMGLTRTKDLTAIGISLLVFAVFLVLLASRDRVNRVLAWLVAAGDINWVVMSFLGLIRSPDALTAIGRYLVIGAALVVAAFAAGQLYYLIKPLLRKNEESIAVME